MLNRILMVALVAGALSGLGVTGVQMLWSVPLILKAETYENAAPAAQPAAEGHVHAAAAQPHDHASHDHGADAWAPEDGIERTFWTAVTNILLGVGGGLVLTAFLALKNGQVSARMGVMFGLAAFASVSLAPALGLPPELPGMQAAELGARQTWWLATAIATAVGLAAIAFAPKAWKAAGLILLVLPHLVGAPQPASHETLVPAELISEFIAASLITAAVFWIGLGGLVGAFAKRFGLSGGQTAAA